MTSPTHQALFASVGVTHSAEAIAFLARTSGLDATHTTAYYTLIDYLVTKGVYSLLDVLRIYGTQDSTTALLNIASSSFNGTLHGSPTFTADRGFTGSDGSSTIYIDSGLNPTSGSPKYTQNDSHIMEWNLTNAQSGRCAVGSIDGAQTKNTYILARYIDDKFYGRINATVVGSGQSTSNSSSIGCFLLSRQSSAGYACYKDKVSQFTVSNTSTALVNQNFYELAFNFNGTAAGVGRQVAAISIGGGLSSTNITDLYDGVYNFLHTVGAV